MTQPEYTFKPLDLSPQGLNEVINLFQAAFGESCPSLETLEWQYLKNPLGPAVGFNAYLGSELAAHYVTIPTQAQIKGQLQKGLLSLNTATHPQHQKKGLFTKLAAMTYDEGTHKGYQFVVGVANHNSVHGFVKKLGFQHVGLLESRLFLNFPPTKNQEVDFKIEWSEDFMRWRLSRPGCSYLIQQNKNVSRLFYEHPKLAFKVWVQQSTQPMNSLALQPLTWKRNPLFYWIGVDSRLDWQKSLTLKISDKYKKVPLNLIFKDLQGAEKIDFKNCAFYAIDFDAY